MFSSTLSVLLLVKACKALVFARNETSAPGGNFSTTATPTPTYPSGPPPAIFPSRITDVPDEDFDCWKSHVSWQSISTSVYWADETEKLTITSYTTTETEKYYGYGSYTVLEPKWDTTLCDGYPRKFGRQTPTGWYPITSTGYYTYTNTITPLPPYPTCTIADYETVCSQLYVSETSIIDRIRSAGYTTDWPLDDTERITQALRPPCTTKATYYPTPTPVTCKLDNEQLQYKVLYWPPKIAGNYSCESGNATVPHVTIPATPTIPGRPNTAHYGDLVLTSPTVYYLLDKVQIQTLVQGSFMSTETKKPSTVWVNKGTVVNEVTLSQDPLQTGISSIGIRCTHKGARHGRYSLCTTSEIPFELENLLTVPASKVVNQYTSTVMQGLFTPAYTYPADLIAEEDQWSICNTFIGGNVRPTYLALPTEKYKYENEPWTWDGVIPPEQATPTPTSTLTPTAIPGSSSGQVPVETSTL